MTLYGLRLLVALLTFGVGVAAASLFNFAPAQRTGREVVTAKHVVAVVTPGQDVPPPPSHACSVKRAVVAGGVLSGKAISKPVPVYPPAAKAAGVGGTVVVQIVVDESGRVSQAEAVGGPSMLRDAAAEAARAARFSPTLLSGQPVKVSGVITYNFVLQ